MSYRIEEPKMLTANDTFIYWCKQKIKAKRHMKIKYERSHSHNTILVSTNGDELEWLGQHIEVLNDKIARIQITEGAKPYFTKKWEEMYQMKSEIIECKKRIESLKDSNLKQEQIIMDEKKFKSILYAFNRKAIEALIAGKVINMKQYLGFLYVNKIPRNHPDFIMKGSAMVNWAESYKYKKDLIAKGDTPRSKDKPEGKNWLVHYTDDFFLKFTWTKKSGACRVKNHGFYGFTPAKGTRKKLAKANDNNKLLHRSYVKKKIYYPRLKKAAA